MGELGACVGEGGAEGGGLALRRDAASVGGGEAGALGVEGLALLLLRRVGYPEDGDTRSEFARSGFRGG
jgi:hypothetical protein